MTNRLQPTDEELIKRIAQHDRNAFETLYERYAGMMLGIAMRVFNERTLSEEITQEALWKVWQRAATFDVERGQVSSWLFSILHHLAIDELRRRRGQAPRSDVDMQAEGFADWPSEQVADVTDVAWANLQSAQVRTALALLPAAQRTVVELAYFEGLTHQEIATQLQEPLGTVHTRARLAINKLKELLKDLRTNIQ